MLSVESRPRGSSAGSSACSMQYHPRRAAAGVQRSASIGRCHRCSCRESIAVRRRCPLADELGDAMFDGGGCLTCRFCVKSFSPTDCVLWCARSRALTERSWVGCGDRGWEPSALRDCSSVRRLSTNAQRRQQSGHLRTPSSPPCHAVPRSVSSSRVSRLVYQRSCMMELLYGRAGETIVAGG
jgi:hypothetical protein